MSPHQPATARGPSFAVVPGAAVARALAGAEKVVVDLVEAAYRMHGAGHTVNPRSQFLSLPDQPDARIIALPASLTGDVAVRGIKWIASFPGNVAAGLPRASAVLVLNDGRTGYPYACLEASIISAGRTAASAALAADWLTRHRRRPSSLGVIGTGLIARYVLDYLTATGWVFSDIGLFDTVADHAEALGSYATRRRVPGTITRYDRAEEVICRHDLLVFATVAGAPHVHEPGLFAHAPVVLHISLRDLAPEVLLASVNVVDDVEHCLTANTSTHLTEQRTGNRDFLDGSLSDVLAGRLRPGEERPVVFSPFGLGVLDLAVGAYAYRRAAEAGELLVVDGFFADLDRYGAAEAEGHDAGHR